MDLFWIILKVLGIILMIVYFNSRNAVWGGATGGFVIGTLYSIYLTFTGDDFSWETIFNAIAIGAIAGFISELLGKLGDRLKRK